MRIILVEPEIPQNTGNIARTCAATGAQLHLIEPMGFSIDEKHVRRAGLDYWPYVQVFTHPSLEAYFERYGRENTLYASTKAARNYAQVRYPRDFALVFGKETRGLPEPLLKENYDVCIRIPMMAHARSLNLGNSVAIVLYEALRQQGFEGLLDQGALTGRTD